MFKQYLYFIWLFAIYNAKIVYSTNTTTYAHDTNQNNTLLLDTQINNNQTQLNTHSILTEGGKINITKPFAHHERENETVSTIKSIVTKKTIGSDPIIIALHNNTNNITKAATTTTIATILNTTQTAYPMDVNGDSKIKPRKGVNMSEATSTADVTKSTPPSTTTFRPRKPTVTFSSDDDPIPPKQSANIKVILNNKMTAPNRTMESPAAPVVTEEEVIGNRRFDKRHPDYVLPIVLTILAVPLLAIILTVLWKRGAEWWYHRHYRRMDFLIDGMYNN